MYLNSSGAGGSRSIPALDSTNFKLSRQRRLDARPLHGPSNSPGLPHEINPTSSTTGEEVLARHKEYRGFSARLGANNPTVNAAPFAQDEGLLPLPSESSFLYSSPPYPSEAPRPARPVSWHPSANSLDFLNISDEDKIDGFGLQNFSTTSMNDLSDMRTYSLPPAFPVTAEQGFVGQPYDHSLRQWRDSSASQIQFQYSEWMPGYNTSILYDSSAGIMNISDYQGASAWMQPGATLHDQGNSTSFIMHKFETSPAGFHSIEDTYNLMPTLSNRTLTAADHVEEVTVTSDKELIGLGLYDNDVTSFTSDDYPGTSMFATYSQGNGKGLKLEETFQPSLDLSSDDEDADDDEESLSEGESARTASFDQLRDFVPPLQQGYAWTTPWQPSAAVIDSSIYHNYSFQPQEGLEGAAEAFRMWSLWDNTAD